MPQLIIGILIIVIAFCVLIYIILPAAAVIAFVAMLWGGVVAIGNYIAAFSKCVKPETVVI